MGIDFYVFDWNREQLIGIFLGMYVKIGAVTDDNALQELFGFSAVIFDNYLANSYHSFYHAVDVTYMVYFYLENLRIAEQMDLAKEDKAFLLLASLGHDVLHPGTNNLFQVIDFNKVHTKTPVAVKYKNISVLELQSADFVQELLEKSNLIESLNLDHPCSPAFKQNFMVRVRVAIEQTDMCHHFSMVSHMNEIIQHQSGSFSTSSQSISVPNPTLENMDLEKLLKHPLHLSRTLGNQGGSSLSIDSMQHFTLPKIRLPSKADLDAILNTLLHAAGKS